MEQDMNMTLMANQKSAEAGLPVYEEILNEDSKRPMEMQEQFLMQLIRDNENTVYGKEHGFKDIHSIEDFRRMIPVQTYDAFAPYINRMVQGEKNVLIAYPCDHFNTTSGTVGNPKYIPMSDRQLQIFYRYNFLHLNGLKAAVLPEGWKEGKVFCTAEGTCSRLDNGMTVGCASAKGAEMIKGKDSAEAQMLRALYTSPVEAMIPEPGTDTKYLHTRYALMEENLTGIVTGFYNMLAHLLQYIVDNHAMLIHDIETGTIDPEVRLPEHVRKTLEESLKPMPERAAQLREAFAEEGPFMKKAWPKLMFIHGAGGDGLAVYDRKIKEKFSGGGLINLYAGVNASEGLWSLPIKADSLDSMLAAGSAFMEFLPVEAGDDFSKAVLMDQVEVGKIYELIITNVNGFYRYRMSDALKVTGFQNKTPLVEFMYRVNKTVSVALEKTTEQALDQTVERVAKELGFFLSDYCIYPDGESNPGKYTFLIEPGIEGTGCDLKTLEECIYKHLSEANPRYAYAVEHEQLQKPDALLLQPETGLLYRDMMVFKGASPSQLKPVHVIINEKQRKFFFGLVER